MIPKTRWIFIFLGLVTGCGHTPSRTHSLTAPNAALPSSLYATVPSGKSLRETPAFFVIDDFNTHDMKNRLGGSWKTQSTQTRAFRFRPAWYSGTNGKRDSFLRFKGFLETGGEVTLTSSLKGLDMSQAEALVLKCRSRFGKTPPFPGKIEMSLSDLKNGSQSFDLTTPCGSGLAESEEWKEVIVPRAQFASTDWSQLKEIQFRISGISKPLVTQIGFDEIAFYGKGDVEFESQRDNLLGFPQGVHNPDRAQALLRETRSDRFLLEIARDTWKYFENAVDRRTHLPVDHIRLGEKPEVGSYTTPTNLAMYLLACISARELGIVSRKNAATRIEKTLETLRLMKRWQGFHYNFYHTGNLQVTRAYASAIDSGWLAAAMVVLRQALPKEFGGLATRFLDEMDFYEYYDPSVGQLRLGFDEDLGDFSPFHYGLLATEARVASLIGIGKGNLPKEHWWFIYRTPPKNWTWQNQVPEGQDVEIGGTRVFEGHYVYQGRKFVPSWGGSLFEFLMPTLILKEKELAPKGLGLNNRIATEIHIDYALNRRGYPVWGLSPASISNGRHSNYREYGVKYLGVKGYKDEGVVAPYAAFLALDVLPDQAIDNVRQMLQSYEVYGEYGFYDSITVRNKGVNTQYLALDQGMILVAIANHIRGGVIKNYFHQDKVGKNIEPLLSQEEFLLD